MSDALSSSCIAVPRYCFICIGISSCWESCKNPLQVVSGFLTSWEILAARWLTTSNFSAFMTFVNIFEFIRITSISRVAIRIAIILITKYSDHMLAGKLSLLKFIEAKNAIWVYKMTNNPLIKIFCPNGIFT